MKKTGWSALQSRPPYSTIVTSDVMLHCNENMKKQTDMLMILKSGTPTGSFAGVKRCGHLS
jgi:hypothetical protein